MTGFCRRATLVSLTAGLALLLAACAPAGNTFADTTSQPGFWLGLWHGFKRKPRFTDR